ncbi:hypothetical protein AAEO56_02425 [Flavobacterium sp. DGU11]|uniref:Lipoprotein n=1 Tax=Flavobacterium arundinis TaxID=3139143 RepID=A0ABU9HSN7_9FLAO
MKKSAWLILISFVLLSCASEKHIVDAIVTQNDEIEAVARKLFKRDFTEALYSIDEIKDDVSKKEMRLLKDRLKCEDIFLIYDKDSLSIADSLVVFTRGGTWDKEHTIVVDMRKKPRQSLPYGLMNLKGRVYYRNVKSTIKY